MIKFNLNITVDYFIKEIFILRGYSLNTYFFEFSSTFIGSSLN